MANESLESLRGALKAAVVPTAEGIEAFDDKWNERGSDVGCALTEAYLIDAEAIARVVVDERLRTMTRDELRALSEELLRGVYEIRATSWSLDLLFPEAPDGQ